MFIMEVKNHKRKRGGKNHVGRSVLVSLALLVTFLPPLIRNQILANSPQRGVGSDLLLTTIIPQIHKKSCQVNDTNGIGVGGIEVDKPPFETMYYTIQPGDTLGEIAENRGLNLDTLLSANQHIRNISLLRAGQRLRLPNQKGVFHKVKKGQTLNNISSIYKVSVEKIVEVNNISKSNHLLAEKEIFIPGARLLPNIKEGYLLGDREFIRPVRAGWFSSGYGYRRDPFTANIQFHTGVDIGAYYGAPIMAAKSGKVIYSGYMQGYGNIIVIRHPNGYITKYAHNSRNLVFTGMDVKQGQVIALMGSSGRSEGPHLHFEIYKNGSPANPASFISLSSRN